ncbi:PfkB family carbohydrate kinase [Lyngbya confervoides]|uniref:PfkB family carbohydrate kinase n=1 Tax=Lyngbya confervoides BDU141951 TaxID=1574623 RepID=A0ABD4SYX5_9CYAN|nr:PfkB family carbohydrate kinase [Lyngbya confervoides]MCM1981345.1 PfkB family carbohydrate kinase [Lyngbya confervoides BDU141951]
MTDRKRQGLFVGLTTLDLIYHAPRSPQSNEKIVATDLTLAAGGPATNAAILFSVLGGEAKLLSVIGQHPLTTLIHHDLNRYEVTSIDLNPATPEPPSCASIVVSTQGDRAVVSRNAQGLEADPSQIPPDLLEGVQVVLMDGHQLPVSIAIAQQAADRGIPTVLDGGSWKKGLDQLLPWISELICSADFRAPHCRTESETLNYLQQRYSPHLRIAITHGSEPIDCWTEQGRGQIPCPSVPCLDTLGAGDFFHGAFSYYCLEMGWSDALAKAADLASFSCGFRGTRSWLSKIVS